NQSGTYQESFTDINGCDSIYNLLLILNKEFGIYAPNVINPSSNINGFFTLFDSGTKSDILVLSIYDRWGELIWQKTNLPTSDPSQGWNGRFHDKPVLPGVYVWMAKVRLPNSEEILIHGNVTVLR
ncbi:MAG: gliding motility-associated C-terminal domain-containing protein, partial [Saprospiraceae bacterium]|nr:gliding motility-associated C-terminal domain-containing protein [Saprospiraceae bacterium]